MDDDNHPLKYFKPDFAALYDDDEIRAIIVRKLSEAHPDVTWRVSKVKTNVILEAVVMDGTIKHIYEWKLFYKS